MKIIEESCLGRTQEKKMSINSRLKAIQIRAQRGAFYRQRTPESRCASRESVDIDVLITSRNGDGKLLQQIRISSGPSTRMRKWNQLSQFRLTSTKVILTEKT